MCPSAKSMSLHFNPNSPLCRKPVDTARSTNVRSRMRKLSTQRLDFSGQQDGWRSAALCTLANEIDRIAIEELVSAGMVEKNGHQISDFGTTAPR
jgi:hypothetical protein